MRIMTEFLSVDNPDVDTIVDAKVDTEVAMPHHINHTLFDVGPVLVIIWKNAEGWPIEFVSQNVAQIIEYSEADCIKSSFHYADIIHPEDLRRIADEVKKHFEQKSTHFEQTYRIKKKSGDYIWIRDYSAPDRDAQGVTRIKGYIYDITKERENELQLIEQNNRYFDIVEATQAGTWEWDILSNRIKINQRWADILGYQLSELKEFDLNAWSANTHKGDVNKVLELIQEHIEGKSEHYEAEFRMRHKDGHWIWLSDRGKIIKRTADGKPLIMVGSHIDITENKKTELMLHHSEKVSAIGRLAGGIAHDINNQLMMIQGYVEILKGNVVISHGEDQLQNIEDIIARSTEIVKQLQSFTKQTSFRSEDIELNGLVTRIGKMMYHTIDKRIALEFSMPTDMPLDNLNKREGDARSIEPEYYYIKGDVSLIENALVNLCLNARDAIIDRGKITLSVTKIILSKPMQTYTNSLDIGAYACITVSDNGVGISEKSLNQIFEPFYTTKDKGTGLGLSTVISALKQYNGGITVESRLGRGTTFKLFFPLLNEKDVNQSASPNKLQTSGRFLEPSDKVVMIVDDEIVLCQVLTQYLESKGFVVKSFIDPRLALDYYEGYSVGVEYVLLDVIMPYMTGNELFDKMIKINPNIKVLYLSGFTEGLSIPVQYQHNIIGLLEKPVKLEKIYDILTHSVDS